MWTVRLFLTAGLALVLSACAAGVDTPPAPPPQPPATITASQPGPPTTAPADCDLAEADMDDVTKSRCGISLEPHGPSVVTPTAALGPYENCRWDPSIGWFCRYSIEGGYFDVPDDDPGLGTCAGRTYDECTEKTLGPTSGSTLTPPAEDSTTATPESTTETLDSTTDTQESTTETQESTSEQDVTTDSDEAPTDGP
ncbi:hypothetical protein GIY23_10340 [Allosaccharopolyspora coralli]|uniref:Lipoprotein n=1 Tax=Allosaccharopolyspora coralli TaxID=2665642 RepID=A0A5Q3Q9I5_9PSEU|nr:hypothetical protein [Allosaccharopolyspora coralli]QGK69864.1 hypothetical protein GIY23_10340 [Allosaccharopolyspora coralli]